MINKRVMLVVEILFLQFILVASLSFSPTLLADVRLPKIISDGMILQRDKPINIWGWADEGEIVHVTVAGKQRTAKTINGQWQVTFPGLKADNKELELQVQAKNTIIIKNVLVGDVWIAAGQSNMEWPLGKFRYHHQRLIETTNIPPIRTFKPSLVYSLNTALTDYHSGNEGENEWNKATPDNLEQFSAVGFFFAQAVYARTKVPIGIINIAVGGSPAEAWVSDSVLKEYPAYVAQLAPYKDPVYLDSIIKADTKNAEEWKKNVNENDEGLKNNWFNPKIASDGWKSFQVPGYFNNELDSFKGGSIWVRKSFYLSSEQANKSGFITLGRIVDADETYINGVLVGSSSYKHLVRHYKVPEKILNSGVNTLILRIISNTGDAGFVEDKPYELTLDKETISLSGEWYYKIGVRASEFPASTLIRYLPTGLFNAKLAPLFKKAISGVIWYQGESNTNRSEEYKTLFPELIADWRFHFEQKNIPFLYVQLANYMRAQNLPMESNWANLREAQRQSLKVKNTAMAVAIDLGEWNDIHPHRKKEVGERLALAAMKLVYGEKNSLSSGPTIKGIRVKGNKLTVTFADIGKGLQIKGDRLQEVAIAGVDKKFTWANADVKKDRIIIWSDDITTPCWVRYAWADNPDKANLYNSANLPASPFEAQAVGCP